MPLVLIKRGSEVKIETGIAETAEINCRRRFRIVGKMFSVKKREKRFRIRIVACPGIPEKCSVSRGDAINMFRKRNFVNDEFYSEVVSQHVADCQSDPHIDLRTAACLQL